MPAGRRSNSSAVIGRAGAVSAGALRSAFAIELAVDGREGAHLPVGVVRRADQGSALDPGEFQVLLGVALELGEFVQGVVAVDGQVLARRLEILPDGEDVDAPGTDVG